MFSRETGQPIVGARVRFALQAQLDEWQRAHPDTPIEAADPEMVLQLCTQPVQTKLGGVALTDSAPGRMLVDASLGRQYGFAWVDRDASARARIDLVEDRAIAVHAHDEQGGPRANVVALVRDSSCTELWRGITDATGTALWRHASFQIERDASPGACVVTLEALESNPRFELIRRPLNSARDIAFDAHKSAILRVNVVDTNGTRVDEPLVVTARTNSSVACSSAVRRTLVNGVATFESVEPGLDLLLEIDGKNAFESASRTVRGPAAAGETRTVDVTAGRRLSVVFAKIVGSDGKPLVKTKTTAWLEYEADSVVHSLPAVALAESDAGGAVRFALPHAPATAKSERLLIVAQNEFGDWFNAERVALAAKLGDGAIDLGVRHLVEMPTLAAGYVLSDKGWPVPNAIVEVSASDDIEADPETFTADARFSTVADQLGRFRLRGWVEGSRIALTCTAPDHSRPRRRIVERGERKVALELPRSAAISGKLLPPPGTSFENVRVWVDRGDEAIPAAVSANLTWRCAGLAAGTYSVRVTIDGFSEPVFAMPTVTLEPGIELDNTEKTTIDLRTRVARFVLRVIDAQGAPIQVASAVVTEPREEGPVSRTVAITRGVLEVIALRPAVDIEIHADGFDTLVMRAVERGGEARLVSSKGN